MCSVKLVPNVPNVAQNVPVGADYTSFSTLGQPWWTKLIKVTDNHQLLCTSPQEPLPAVGIASADKQKCSRVGQKSGISGLFQPASFGPRNQQQMETYTRSEQSQQIPQGRKIQNGDIKNDPNLPTDRGLGDIHRFQGCLLPYPRTKPIKEISEISCSGQNIPVQSTTIWPVHSSLGVHCSDQRGQTNGFAEGYKNPPILRRLVGPGQIPPNLSPAYTNISKHLGWIVNMEKSELDPKQVFDFVGYQFDLKEGKVRPTLD